MTKLSPERVQELTSLSRAMACHVLPMIERHTSGRTSEVILSRTWPNDARASLFLKTVFTPRIKGAVSPTSTADVPARRVVEVLAAMAPASGALQILSRGQYLSLAGLTSISLPGPSQPLYDAVGALVAPLVPFVQEGYPAPFVEAHLAAPQLGPVSKLMVLSGITEELQAASPTNAATLIGNLLSLRMSASIDHLFFSNTAASAAAPAGLRCDHGLFGRTARRHLARSPLQPPRPALQPLRRRRG
jgi:hypothetical protein